MSDNRLTDDELDEMIADVGHWGDDYSAKVVLALRELCLLRHQQALQADGITRLHLLSVEHGNATAGEMVVDVAADMIETMAERIAELEQRADDLLDNMDHFRAG